MEHREYLDRLHAEILSIVSEIVKICEKNRLRYYLVEGSLLGAVRHCGFIPWDDDVDIAMPRSDYDRFIECCCKDLDDGFYLDWLTTNPNYYHMFAKVCKKGTEFVERIGKSNTVSHGIFVDIFPLDKSNGSTSDTKKKKERVGLCNRILSAKYNNKGFSIFRRTAAYLIPAGIIKSYALRMINSHQESDYRYYTNYESVYSIEKETFPIEDFGNGISARFEEMELKIPDHYKKILATIYGDDYMKLPPLKKRVTHNPLKVTFSDGTIVEFDE